MKKSLITFAILLTLICTISCERTAFQPGNPLTVSKTSSIQKGEPVNFSFESEAGDDKITWKVTPAQKVNITPLGKNARIQFGEAGNYVVTATDQINISRSTVTVDSTTYVPKDSISVADTIKTGSPRDTIETTVPDKPVVTEPVDTIKTTPIDTVGTHNIYLDLKNATFTLIPTLIDTLSTSGLMINIQSDNIYKCGNSYLGFSHFFQNPVNKAFRLNLYHVVQPGARYCEDGEKKVSGTTFIYPLSEGDNKIEITMNGNLYNGVINKNKNVITINWTDLSAIKFSRTIITK